MFSTVLGFPEGRVIAPFLRQRPQVFPRIKVLMNLKRLVVLLYSKLSVIRLYLFFFGLLFVLEEKWPIRLVVLLDPSIFIGNKMEDGNVRFSMKRKGQYTAHVFSCEFCEIFKKTFFSEHVRATVSEYSRIEFCLKIDGNSDTVHLIEGFVF